jgi:serine/threonine protein kinase
MPPELFSENSKVSKEADMYAFGIVVYEVVTGAYPFERRRTDELPNKPGDPVAIGFGEGTWEFAERCWRKRELRPTAGEALEHFKRVARDSKVVGPSPIPWANRVTVDWIPIRDWVSVVDPASHLFSNCTSCWK